MTTAATHIKRAEASLAAAARSLALALQHDPASVTTLTGLQRELMLRHGFKRALLAAERSVSNPPRKENR